MVTGLHVAVVGLLCLHLTDSQAATQSVTGPDVLVTNGSQPLTLTCPDIPGGARYEWFTPQPDTQRCPSGTGKVCTFTPTPDEDNKNVICTVLNSEGETLQQSTYTTNLSYPPQSDPFIMTEQAGKQTLQQGDVITCTVSGGKPLVTNVTFYCDPGHPDEDDVIDDGKNVSSRITVKIPETTPDNVRCFCSAYWAPEPEFYTRKIDRIYPLGTSKQSRVIANGLGVVAFAVIVIMCLT